MADAPIATSINERTVSNWAAPAVSGLVSDALSTYNEPYYAYGGAQVAEAQPLQTQENEVQPAPTPPTPAREVPVDEKAANWKRNNEWFNQDREMTSLALAVHERLVQEEGVDPRSDTYYARIDARMREKFPEKFPNSSRKSNVVAPATRSIAPKKIVLTPSAVSIAKRLGIPLELYARKVAEEMRNANG